MSNLVKNIYLFYSDGFKSMTIGRTLWIIILVKLFIMFLILKLFFFRSELATYKTIEQKSRHVIEQITQ